MSVETAVKASGHKRSRVVFIDALRLLATFQMVQGHTLDAVLTHQVRHGWGHDLWQSARGLTAVSFLFAAGLAYHETTLTRLDVHRATAGGAKRRRLRALRLIGLGYLLHVPLALLWTSAPDARARIVSDFVSVDVLQCMGVSLLLMEALAAVLVSARVVAAVAGLAGLALFVAAPVAHTVSVAGPWAALLGYVSPTGGSIFPLLPWAGHFALGVGVAHWARRQWAGRLATVAVALGVLGSLVERVEGAQITAMHLQRVASVALICAGLSWLLRHRQRLASWLERLAGETLAVYVFHILLVYGAGVGLGAQIGPRLALPAAVLLTLAVLALSVGVALTWRRLAARVFRPRRAT